VLAEFVEPYNTNNHQPDEPLQHRPAPAFDTFDATASAA
jgi:hypothetical protein